MACQLPNSRIGEQLFFQFMIAIAGKMWYYQYGRMGIGFTGPNSYWGVSPLDPRFNARGV